jgi:hypothetical protein
MNTAPDSVTAAAAGADIRSKRTAPVNDLGGGSCRAGWTLVGVAPGGGQSLSRCDRQVPRPAVQRSDAERGCWTALCRAHSKTSSFFGRHALEFIAIAGTNPLAKTPRHVERTGARRCQLAGPTGQLHGHRRGGTRVPTPGSQGHRRHQQLSGCRNATGQHGVADGELAWRQHDGGQEDRCNMKHFITWANRLLNRAPPPEDSKN